MVWWALGILTRRTISPPLMGPSPRKPPWLTQTLDQLMTGPWNVSRHQLFWNMIFAGKKVSKYRAASQYYIISDVGESWEDRKFDCNVYLSLSIYINSSVITESYCILIEVWWVDLSGVLHDKETENIGRSLFTHSNGQSSNTFFDKDWLPEFDFKPLLPDNV